MNRAPIALLMLLCTLASSMVAAGVANDRPDAGMKKGGLKSKPSPVAANTKFTNPPRRTDWFSTAGIGPVDVRRYLLWDIDQLPIVSADVPGARLPLETPKVEAPKAKPTAPQKAVAATPAAVVKPRATVAKPAAVESRVSCSFARPVFQFSAQPRLHPQVAVVLDIRQANSAIASAADAARIQRPAAVQKPAAPKAVGPSHVTLGPSQLRLRFSSVRGNNWTESRWFVPPYATHAGSIVLGHAAELPAADLAQSTWNIPATTITVVPTYYESLVARARTAQAALAYYGDFLEARATTVRREAIDGVIAYYGKITADWFGKQVGEVRSAQRPEKAESR